MNQYLDICQRSGEPVRELVRSFAGFLPLVLVLLLLAAVVGVIFRGPTGVLTGVLRRPKLVFAVVVVLVLVRVGLPERARAQSVPAVPVYAVYTGHPGLEHTSSHVARALAEKPAWRTLHYLGPNNPTTAANRAAACGRSVARSDGMTCDEFPFASTFEGGLGAHVELVPESEVLTQARDLSAFYRMHGLVACSEFQVQVIDDAPFTPAVMP